MGAIITCAARDQAEMDGRVVCTPSTSIHLPDGAIGVYAAEIGDPEKARTVSNLPLPSRLGVMLARDGAYEEYESFKKALSTKTAAKTTCCGLLEPRPPTPAALRAAVVAEYQPRFKAHDIDIYLCQVVEHDVSGTDSCSTSWYTFVDRLSNKHYVPAETVDLPSLGHPSKVPAVTHLTHDCPAGSKVLKVASQSGFKMDQIVKISGDAGTEFNKIVSFSTNRARIPLIVSTPVAHSYTAMSTVTAITTTATTATAETQLMMLRPQHLLPIDAWFTVGTPALMKDQGCFYYEVKIGKDLHTPQFGWATNLFQVGPPDEFLNGVGDDTESWGADGRRFKMWHGEQNGRRLGWPRKWEEGDIIGLAIDIDAGVMQFSLNGDWVEEQRTKFEAAGRHFYPAISARGHFTMLVPSRKWQTAPPSRKYQAWANSGTYERLIVSSPQSKS